jgi:hypothetical protein
MGRDWPARSMGGSYRTRSEAPLPTLVALLLAIGVPALFVALAMGWRPLDAAHPYSLPQLWERVAGPHERPAATAPGAWSLPNGHFFAYPPGQPAGASVQGYAVTDADGQAFWSEYQRLGGSHYLGFPRSNRFPNAEGATVQVFQRAVLRSDGPETGIAVVPLLDWLHDRGQDAALGSDYGIPPTELPLPEEATPELLAERLEWVLRDHPALAAYVAGMPDAYAVLGLPTSAVHDVGSYYVVRFQGGALQEWKQDVPWARAGDVTAANVGEIATALGLFPTDALAATGATPPAAAAGEPRR